MNAIATIDPRPLPPSIIGFNVNGQTLSTLDTLKHVASNITVKGLWKVGAATAIAAGATAVRGANVALSEIEYSRAQMAEHLALMQAQRDDAVRRAADAEAKARKPSRWSAAECDMLTELRASGLSYARIAAELGTGRTAAAVGAKARALAGKVAAPAKAAKAARASRKRSRKAV
jgi:hypothetical protein